MVVKILNLIPVPDYAVVNVNEMMPELFHPQITFVIRKFHCYIRHVLNLNVNCHFIK